MADSYRVNDRGYDDRGERILWVAIDAWDRSDAREIASAYGRITEADVTDDGLWSFVVEANAEAIVALDLALDNDSNAVSNDEDGGGEYTS